jgi:hypothetical protein
VSPSSDQLLQVPALPKADLALATSDLAVRSRWSARPVLHPQVLHGQADKEVPVTNRDLAIIGIVLLVFVILVLAKVININ